jgi:hypothetical protein
MMSAQLLVLERFDNNELPTAAELAAAWKKDMEDLKAWVTQDGVPEVFITICNMIIYGTLPNWDDRYDVEELIEVRSEFLQFQRSTHPGVFMRV